MQIFKIKKTQNKLGIHKLSMNFDSKQLIINMVGLGNSAPFYLTQVSHNKINPFFSFSQRNYGYNEGETIENGLLTERLEFYPDQFFN